MAAQVEVQTGEVGRTVVGGRLHLSPLNDSSNKSLIEDPSSNQSLIITPQPSKPAPSAKPRLTPKPFALERNPIIKPILAPKPHTKPRPEPTRLAGYKPDPPNTPKPPQPVVTSKPKPVSTNPNRPSPTAFKPSSKLNTGQTTKPVAQPFKPAPPVDLGDPTKPTPPVPAERKKPVASRLAYSRSPTKPPAAEWSGTTKKEEEKAQTTSSTSVTRAKSMGFLNQIAPEEEEKEKQKPEAAVPLRSQPRGSRPRPVSAIYFAPPAKTESPTPAPRWTERRPLSADLTSKFESIGLSLHRKSPNTNTKENAPEDRAQLQKKELDKNPKGITTETAKPAVSDEGSKSTEEMDEDGGVSIKTRISLFLDSTSSPGAGSTGQGSDLHSPGQPVPEGEPPLGVKQRIKQLTEDTAPTQNPVLKSAPKPRPLPFDLTKRFTSERSTELGIPSLSEGTDCSESSTDPQRRIEESVIIPSNQSKLVDMKDSQEQVKKASMVEGSEEGQMVGSTSKESGPSSEIQTVRASVFDNVVERHSVLMLDDEKPDSKAKDGLSTLSHKREDCEDEGSLVTATYKEPVSPSSPLRVFHSFETVQAREEIRAVSESVPSAQREDKAMTLRSRHSEGNRPVAERIGSAQREADLAPMSEQQPRYLRIGALPKWTTTDLSQQAGTEKGMQKESERDRQVALEKERERQKEAEQEEAAAAAKGLKMLQADEQPKLRATYFALTGQIQEPVPPVDTGADFGNIAVPFGDFSVRPAQWGSQAKIAPVRRNPSLDKAFGKNPQREELTERSQMSDRERSPASDSQTTEEVMEVEKKRELKKEAERQKAGMKELEREKQKHLEKERQALLEFARMKEREMQREYERQRQKEFEKEKQELEKKQHALERKKQLEQEKQQELERERQRELERERQQQLEREKQQELERERQREIERERLRDLEREKQRELEKERQREQQRQRQREQERQRELDKERQLLELQKERRRAEELERMKEMEKRQLLEFQRQKQKEKERQQAVELEKQRLREKMEKEEAEKIKQMALQHEMERLKELEKERERQREMEMERLKEIEMEKQRELERQKQRDLEKERQKQLDLVRQELENQKLRQQELEKEKKRKEDLERIKEWEKRQLLEFEKQKQVEREKQQLAELEKRRLREKMEREEAEKMRKVAKQQETERQRLKEKQKKEEQERRMLDSAPLRPKVLDLDSVLRDDSFSKASPQRTDPATRWKQASPRTEETYKPAILDIDSFLSQTQHSSSKDMLPVSAIQGMEAGNGASRVQPHTPEWEINRKVPPQTSVGLSGPLWTPSPQDSWDQRPSESVDKPVAAPELPRKHTNKISPEQLLLRQEERLLAPERRWSGLPDEPLQLAPIPGTDAKTGSPPDRVSSSISVEQILLPRDPEPHNNRREVLNHRRSHGSQLDRLRSRSVSRRSTPSNSGIEGNLSRMRSHSAHRESDRQIWVQQKQSVSGEEEGKDSDTPVHETDSQYGTWETGLRTDDSLTPATPSSDSNLSPSPRKPTPPHTPGEQTASLDPDTLDGLSPSSPPENQPLPFPDAPFTLLDNSALRSRAQLGKKRAPRSRPSKAARQNAALALLTEAEGATEDWRYRDSTEEKVESKNEDSDSEEQARGADAVPAASQPQRIPLFPGMDPSALKAQLKKRSDTDNQSDGSTPSPSQLSRSPKSPFLPQAARVLPPAGGKENGEEESPQWLKELKSKKRLSQYDMEN